MSNLLQRITGGAPRHTAVITRAVDGPHTHLPAYTRGSVVSPVTHGYCTFRPENTDGANDWQVPASAVAPSAAFDWNPPK